MIQNTNQKEVSHPVLMHNELSAKCRVIFNVYFADGGFVIQSQTRVENPNSDPKYSETLHIVTEFSDLGTRIQEIIVRQALEIR